MDSTVPRSTCPVAVTVASEQEPVKCEGVYAEHSGGFALDFNIGAEKFTVTHAEDCTRVTAHGGAMSYDIALSEKPSSVLLGTPFGEMRFTVKTLERTVERADGFLRVALKYVLSSAAAGDIERAVDVTAWFLQ
ncbi:MAG: hypothetical protein K2L54_00610 [Clostridiales bacterium]|nr:hypothetical protein [Clostridiales bacterium]